MSLLLDALKKAGRTQPGAAPPDATHEVKPELTLQEVAQPEKQATHTVEDNLARVAGQNLFAAKAQTAASGRQLNVLALVAGGALLLAAGGAYYVWSEISPAEPRYGAVTAPPGRAVPIIPLAATAPNARVEQSDAPAGTVAATPRPAAPKRRAASRREDVVIERGQTQAAASAAAAYQAYSEGDFATAWQIYRAVLQQDARNRDALLGLAAIALQQDQDEVAAQYYSRVLTLDPRDPEAHAGMSALIPGDAAGKESRLKLLLAHRPDAAALHFALGNLYAEQSRWADAQQAYFTASSREPGNAHYAFNLAVSLDHLGQGKLAAQYYQRALQLDKSGSTGFDRAQTQRRADELTVP